MVDDDVGTAGISLAGHRKRLWTLVLVAAGVSACLWVYSPVWHGAWLWDDDQYIVQNESLRSLGGLLRIWLDPVGVNYFPLTATVQWAEWQLWGNSTTGYHAVNIALHVTSALLIWRLFSKLGLRLAALGGLIFALHPVTVESVAWISELKNTLSLPLLLMAMIAFVDFEADESRASYFHAFSWFFAALLAKATVVMFPIAMLLYYWWKRGRIARASLRAIVPFLFLSLSLGSVTWWFERTRGIGSMNSPLEGVLSRIIAAGLGAAFYFSKCLCPIGLMPIYPRWSVMPLSFGQLYPWPLIAALLLFFWAKRDSWGRPVLFCVGCFLMYLAPILGVIPMAYLRLSWVADHFAYVSLVPLVGIFMAGVDRIGRSANAPFVRRYGAVGLSLIAAMALATASHHYAEKFVNPEALWSYEIRANPDAWSAHNDLGTLYFDDARLADAVTEFRACVRLNPRYAEAHNNLGVALLSLKEPSEAIPQFLEALEVKPDYANASCNLGNAFLETGRLVDAVSRYREAIHLKADFPEAHYNLALALRALGQIDAADIEFALSKGLKRE